MDDPGVERLGRVQPQRDPRPAVIEQPHALGEDDRLDEQLELVRASPSVVANLNPHLGQEMSPLHVENARAASSLA